MDKSRKILYNWTLCSGSNKSNGLSIRCSNMDNGYAVRCSFGAYGLKIRVSAVQFRPCQMAFEPRKSSVSGTLKIQLYGFWNAPHIVVDDVGALPAGEMYAQTEY